MTFKEKRIGDRRKGDRRSSKRNGNFSGNEKRSVTKERRITIVNRHNIEVTDRRSFN
jgi:hypothetical protein